MSDSSSRFRYFRLVIGGAICVVVWALFVVRVALGIGPMHDHQGHQSPVSHYLFAAVVGTAMVAVWLKVRGVRD